MSSEAKLQREYYERTASEYDALHSVGDPEHNFALCCFSGLLDYIECQSVLDVGAGTGRTMLHLAQRHTGLRVAGVEPVEGLREVAYSKGIAREVLQDGDATSLEFGDGAFDIVCAFGVLHHIKAPEAAIREMLRVAKIGVFISDTNNYGQGSPLARAFKQLLRGLGLWRVFDLIRTGGRGYMESPEDGIFYSFSLFDHLGLIRQHCSAVHFIATRPSGPRLYQEACHIGLLGLKRTV